MRRRPADGLEDVPDCGGQTSLSETPSRWWLEGSARRAANDEGNFVETLQSYEANRENECILISSTSNIYKTRNSILSDRNEYRNNSSKSGSQSRLNVGWSQHVVKVSSSCHPYRQFHEVRGARKTRR